MLKFGYGGRVLRINLTERKSQIEMLDPLWVRDVIGGRAANTKRLFEELDPNCDSLGPDNILIFGIGPLTGSLLPASAYYTVTAKSPLTGILGDSTAGGQFAAEMKLTGFDQIIITGRADSLVYLMVTESGAELVDCPEYAGKTITEVTKSIRRERKNYSIQVAAIGPAGENHVLFSAIVSSGNRVNGRTGMGAVMGAKNLKALAVRGSHSLEVADPLAFLSEVEKIVKDILSHKEYKKRYQMGTTMLMKDLNNIGILPTKHFQEGVCIYVDEISGQKLESKHKVKNKACFNCNLHCSRYYMVGDLEAEGPEFETLCSFTSRIGNSNLPFALEMNAYLNQMGLDSISTSEVMGWIMECQEKGLIHPDDLDGLSITWGEVDKIRDIVNMITFRRGIGDKLANGAKKLAESFGEEARKLVMQVKGLDMICGDPRGIKGYGLTYAIASRGADHLRAEPYFELTNRKDEAKKRFGTEKAADRLAEEGKAALVSYSEKIALLTDSMTMCKNIGLCMDILNFERASALLKSATGIDYSPEYLEKIMGDFFDIEFKLNRSFGLRREDDTLPERFLKEPLNEGPTKGSTVDIKRMVDEYYKIHKWE
ncbi:MAG: aldehyde ferredoxin oxidoreductase family protein [Candidatus Aminicenantes bacterium]|nr:aldehyde ferredoxin oxidoreductase family protein [Candidatus Aminicenantes bacterium]MDH5714012.1 aldehyde ferredoxin oxidoreductase family protein [Candidatus Aminicenantes bacterium]